MTTEVHPLPAATHRRATPLRSFALEAKYEIAPEDRDWNRRPAAIHQVIFRGHRDAGIGVVRTIDTNDLRAHIGEQHAAELCRAEARDFDDPEAV